LAAAGVTVEELRAAGHFHSSFTMVDVVVTGVGGREKMAAALRRFAGLSEETGLVDRSASQGRAAPPQEVSVAAQ
jgi:hypothetical protein